MARNRLQVAISLLDRPVLILTNQPTVGGRKRVIKPGGRGGAKGAEAKVIIVLRFILRFLLSLIKRQETERRQGQRPAGRNRNEIYLFILANICAFARIARIVASRPCERRVRCWVSAIFPATDARRTR